MQKFSSKLYKRPLFIPELGMYQLKSKLHDDWVLVAECKYLYFNENTGSVESEYYPARGLSAEFRTFVDFNSFGKK